MADTMLRFENDKLNNFLSKEQLKSMCPTAFKTSPTNPKVSNRYVYANTEVVIDDLAKLGWYPVEAKQCRATKRSNGIRSFHMICFQNPDVKVVNKHDDGTEEIDAFPRLILTNSHDGFNSFKFMVGLFRLVCSNGLCVSNENFVNTSIKHINYTFDELRKVVVESLDKVPEIVMTMNQMKQRQLTESEQKELAYEVVKIRKNFDDNVDVHRIGCDDETIRDILTPIRTTDIGTDLWTVFNVCQEKMMRGGYYSSNRNNKKMKQRSIKSIKKDLDFNQRLWKKAESMLEVEHCLA
jgi:hypothetical protein